MSKPLRLLLILPVGFGAGLVSSWLLPPAASMVASALFGLVLGWSAMSFAPPSVRRLPTVHVTIRDEGASWNEAPR